MWRDVSQPNLHDKHLLGWSTIHPYRVSLLAVRRILRVPSGEATGSDVDYAYWERMNSGGQRNGFGVGGGQEKQTPFLPMAKPNCLLLVRSSLGEDYLFEASCPEERDRIVQLWKMTTARLVSHAVIGNGEMMVREFFNELKVSGGIYTTIVSTEDA